MSSAVFISHSSRDRKTAETLCEAIETRGIPCWISSRDIGPGANFQESIVQAVRSARVMVLVFTANANNSNEIKKELALASQNELAVIPVRVEDVVPNDAFSYEFATRQWIDVFGDWERAVGRLVEHINHTLGETPAKTEDATPGRSRGTSTKADRSSTIAIAIAAVVAVMIVAGAAWYRSSQMAAQSVTAPPPANVSSTPAPDKVAAAPSPAPKQDPPAAAPDTSPQAKLTAANAAYSDKRFDEAVTLYRAAATAGNPVAEFKLGHMYQLGEGLTQDYTSAAYWFNLSANQGQKEAELAMGFLAEQGLGVPKDPAGALRWYQLAADQGSGQAQFRIGLIYERGAGVPRDQAKAHDWIVRAAASGDDAARRWLASH